MPPKVPTPIDMNSSTSSVLMPYRRVKAWASNIQIYTYILSTELTIRGRNTVPASRWMFSPVCGDHVGPINSRHKNNTAPNSDTEHWRHGEEDNDPKSEAGNPGIGGACLTSRLFISFKALILALLSVIKNIFNFSYCHRSRYRSWGLGA